MKKLTFFGFLGSVIFHSGLLFLLWLLLVHSRGSYGFNAPVTHTHISMEMLKGIVVEDIQPLSTPTSETSAKEQKIDIPDPTLTPQVKENTTKQVKKEKNTQERIQKVQVTHRSHKKKIKNQQKGKKPILSDASINSQATSNGKAKGENPRLVGNGAQLDERAAYLSALRSEIERHKTYPKRAKIMRKQGVVEIEFILTASGELKNIRIRRSSGNADLDKSALDATLQAKPIGLHPQGIDEFITVPIRFSLN